MRHKFTFYAPKLVTILAVALCSTLVMAQTNQYFWYNGHLMMGNAIAQIDSITFGNDDVSTDTLHLLLPRTIVKTVEVHDTIYIAHNDTVYIHDCDTTPKH